MNAPPISEATFMVEEARSEMVEPEAGILAGAAGTEELIWADDVREENPAKKRNATKAVDNDLIKRLNLPLQPETENSELPPTSCTCQGRHHPGLPTTCAAPRY